MKWGQIWGQNVNIKLISNDYNLIGEKFSLMKTTPIKAARKKCLDCCCGSPKAVKYCTVNECALWSYRFGIRPSTAKAALNAGADILIVGRYITQSRDVERSVENFLEYLPGDIDLFRVHIE